MKTLEEKILQYGLLAPAEQLALELDVESRPQYATLLKEVRALYQLIAEVLQVDVHHTDEMVAYLAAKSLLNTSSLPANLSTDADIFQLTLDADPAVAQRYAQIKSHMALLIESQDPVAQFETLTGHKVTSDPRRLHRDRAPKSALHERSDAQLRSRRHLWAGVGSLVLVLFLVLSVNRPARLAYLTAAELEATRPIHLRSMILAGAEVHTPESLARDERYLQSFAALATRYAGAQKRRFFVQYTYDDAVLPELARKLEVLAGADQIPEELLMEVRYLLAKVYLASGKTEKARGQLLEIQQHAGFKPVAVKRLLWQL